MPCEPLAVLPEGSPVPLSCLDLGLQLRQQTGRLLILVLLLTLELVALLDLPGYRVQLLEVLRVVANDDIFDLVSSLTLELDLWVQLEDLGN